MTDGVAQSFTAMRQARADGNPGGLRDARRALAQALLESGGTDGLAEAETALEHALAGLDETADERAIRAAASSAADLDRDALRRIASQGPLPFAGWLAEDPPPRSWLIPGVLPTGRLASVYGGGGTGKSFMALQLAHAVMHGGAVLPADPMLRPETRAGLEADHPISQPIGEKGPVLLLTWEDEVDEIRRRWLMAHRAGAISRPHPDPAMLHLIDMRAIGGPLWGPGEGGHVSTQAGWTGAGRRFLETVRDHALVIVDPLAAAFGSNENDRALVRQFAGALDRAAEAAGASALIIGHPPKTGDSGYSGSTDWRNAARASFHLELSDAPGCEIPGDGPKARPANAFCLTDDKASYASRGHRLWLRMHRDPDPGRPREARKMCWYATTAPEAARARDGEARPKTNGEGAKARARGGTDDGYHILPE